MTAGDGESAPCAGRQADPSGEGEKDIMTDLPHVTPESVGIPSSKVTELIARIKPLDSVNGIVMLRHGKVFLDAAWKPYANTTPHQLFSASKSFVSLAVGFAQQEGLLKISDRLIGFFPEHRNAVTDEKMLRTTLRHLLTMASGHAACPMGELRAGNTGWTRTFLASKLPLEPGSQFAYNSAATYMLAAVIRKVTGENVREYLIPRLFKPLGIAPGVFECDPQGTNIGGWGLYQTAQDLAILAQCLLQKGKWKGKQVLPAEYLKEATAKQIENGTGHGYSGISKDWRSGYGFQFWQSEHGYRGDGAGGQYVLVVPEADIAAGITSCLDNMPKVLTDFYETVLAACSDGALPADPRALAELNGMLDSLEIPMAQGDVVRRGEPATFECAEKGSGIKRISVSFDATACILTFDTAHGPETMRAGFGFRIHNRMTLCDISPRRCTADAAWISETKLEVRVCNYETLYRDIYTFDVARDAETPFAIVQRHATQRPLFPREFKRTR